MYCGPPSCCERHAGARSALLLAWQMGVLALLAYHSLGVLQGRVLYLQRTPPGSFARSVLGMQYMLYLAMFWALPLIWWDAPRLHATWRQWEPFQASGHPVQRTTHS